MDIRDETENHARRCSANRSLRDAKSVANATGRRVRIPRAPYDIPVVVPRVLNEVCRRGAINFGFVILRIQIQYLQCFIKGIPVINYSSKSWFVCGTTLARQAVCEICSQLASFTYFLSWSPPMGQS